MSLHLGTGEVLARLFGAKSDIHKFVCHSDRRCMALVPIFSQMDRLGYSVPFFTIILALQLRNFNIPPTPLARREPDSLATVARSY